MHEQDQDYQRILWRFSSNDPVWEFRLNTVTYGLASALFLAIRCVRHLASNASNNFQQASNALLNDSYVDDILIGVDSKTKAINLISQLKKLLNSSGFEPHKWHSNCKEVLTEANDRVNSAAVAINVNTVKALSLNWYPEQDTFQFSVQSVTSSIKIKREELSEISRLFDPLGLISLILIRAKLIMQGT